MNYYFKHRPFTSKNGHPPSEISIKISVYGAMIVRIKGSCKFALIEVFFSFHFHHNNRIIFLSLSSSITA